MNGNPCLQENPMGPKREDGTGHLMGGKTASRLRAFSFLALRLFLGAVFLFASYDKILHPEAFARAVYNYQILPDGAVNLAALMLPWLELLLGLCLISGFWLPGATVFSSLLLAVFLGALVFNRIRGIDAYCGCFSVASGEGTADLWTVARDFVFFGISAYLAWVMLFYQGKKEVKPS